MKAVLQRVKFARVSVGDEVIGEIGKGLLVYLGVERGDGPAEVDYMARKTRGLRIFGDEAGRMNLDVKSAGGSVLVVSQFTLLADCRKGRRPAFTRAEDPEKARTIYESFIMTLKKLGLTVEAGRFGAHMEVSSINDGPVTMIIESPGG